MVSRTPIRAAFSANASANGGWRLAVEQRAERLTGDHLALAQAPVNRVEKGIGAFVTQGPEKLVMAVLINGRRHRQAGLGQHFAVGNQQRLQVRGTRLVQTDMKDEFTHQPWLLMIARTSRLSHLQSCRYE